MEVEKEKEERQATSGRWITIVRLLERQQLRVGGRSKQERSWRKEEVGGGRR